MAVGSVVSVAPGNLLLHITEMSTQDTETETAPETRVFVQHRVTWLWTWSKVKSNSAQTQVRDCISDGSKTLSPTQLISLFSGSHCHFFSVCVSLSLVMRSSLGAALNAFSSVSLRLTV